MSLVRRTLIVLGVIAALLLSLGAVAAKGNEPPKPPRATPTRPKPTPAQPPHITWTPKQIVVGAAAGQTTQFTASFVSSADIAVATLVIPGNLGHLVLANPSSLTGVKAGVPVAVTFTVRMPATRAHEQSGVVQVRAGQREIAGSLVVAVKLGRAGDRAPAATPVPTHAPEPTAIPAPTATPEPTRAPEPTAIPAPTSSSSAYPGPNQL